MKIDITPKFGKVILRTVVLGVALFSGVITFILSGPAVSESQELKVVNNPVASVLPIKQQIQDVKVVKKEISFLRKEIYAEYRRKMHNGQVLLRRINKHRPIIDSAARYYNLDPDLIVGLIALESGGKNWAISGVQARGLMQIYIAPTPCIKQVKELFKVAQLDLHNPNHNIYLGAATLAQYIQSKRDPLLGLVAYNAGPGAVKSRSFSEFSQKQTSKDIKRFPLIVSAYALMAKIQKKTGVILPLNDETQGIFNSIELPGVI